MQQQQQCDSEHGTLHDDDSFVVNQEGDDIDPELYFLMKMKIATYSVCHKECCQIDELA